MLISNPYQLLSLVLLSSCSLTGVTAIESAQCSQISDVRDLFMLRDGMGSSLGKVVSTLREDDADILQTGTFMSSAKVSEVDFSSNIISRMVDLVLGDSNFLHANGTDIRQGDAKCTNLPLNSEDCYVRYLPEENAMSEKVVGFIPMAVQVLDTMLNTVGFFQELNIPSLLARLSVPVTFDSFQRRRLEKSQRQLEEKSLKLDDKARATLKEYLTARKRQLTSKPIDESENLLDLQRSMFGVDIDILKALRDQKKLRRRNQEADGTEETLVESSMLNSFVGYFLDISDFLIEYSSRDDIGMSLQDEGTCIVFNNETFAVTAMPGFPSEAVYDFCNCASSAVSGALFCPVKHQVTGFAASSTNKLSYEVPIPVSVLLFDGLAQQTIPTSGDVWIGLDMTASIPKLGNLGVPSPNPDPQKVLECAGVLLPEEPTATTSAVSRVSLSSGFGGEVSLKSSVFTDLPGTSLSSTGIDEFVSLAALEESNVTVKIGDEGFFNFSLFPGYGAARLNSANPTCQPSGFFMSNLLSVKNITTDSLLAPFITSISSKPNSPMNFGLALSNPATGRDFAQFLFLNSQISFNWLGFELNGGLSFQYADESELGRRRNFESNGCCQGGACSRSGSPLSMPALKNVSKPAVNILITTEEAISWGTLSFQDVQFSFNYQPEDKPEIFFDSSVLAPGLNWIPATVRLEHNSLGGPWTASFYSSLSEVLNSYPVSLSGSNLLQPENGGIITTLPDWNLFFEVDWQSTSWITQVEEIVFSQFPTVDSQPVTITSARNHGEKGSIWERITDLAKDLGGNFELLVDVLDANFLGLSDLLPALQILKDVLETGVPGLDISWPIDIAAEINVADLLNINLALSISESILRGDLDVTSSLFDELGWDFELTFGLKTSLGKESEKHKKLADPLFDCDLMSYEYEDNCVELPDGQKFNCQTKRESYFPEPQCFREGARKMNELYNIINDALWFESNCEAQSNRADISLAEGFSITSPQTVFPFGEETCQISFELNFPRVSIGGQIDFSSVQIISDVCLIFDTATNIISSFASLRQNLADKVIDITTRAGRDGSCTPLEERRCDDPLLTVPQFSSSVTMSCNENFSGLNLNALFGASIFNTDERCRSFSSPIFDFDLTIEMGSDSRKHKDNNWNGCGALAISVQRYGEDCCHQFSEPLIQTLFIEREPPQFYTPAGSLDVTTTCDANLHPRVTGMPEFAGGCRDSVTTVDVEETKTLDATTCVTTLERTFVLRDDGCEETQQQYVQTIALSDDYTPEWDYFPEDVTLRVFDPYGTEATGFPTAFQKCGLPVHITYNDTVISIVGDTECSSGFMIIERTFRAIDDCGKAVERTQVIRIGNEELPFGPKANSFVYAGDELIVDEVNFETCLINSDLCSISGAPADNTCGSSSKITEFSGYRQYLNNRGGDLASGITRGLCACQHKHCQKRSDNEINTYYAVPQVVDADHSCSMVESETGLTTRGNATSRLIGCPGNPTSSCTAVHFTGNNPVYNIFRLQAEDLGLFTIQIEVPKTSFTLINVVGVENVTVTIDPTSGGIELLTEGLDPSRILWNFPFGVNILGNSANRVTPFVFQGTMFNRMGSFQFDASPGSDDMISPFKGQLFANKVNVRGVRFDCGAHFVGFSEQSCTDPWADTRSTKKSVMAANPDGFW